jgi:hypothetical protein
MICPMYWVTIADNAWGFTDDAFADAAAAVASAERAFFTGYDWPFFLVSGQAPDRDFDAIDRRFEAVDTRTRTEFGHPRTAALTVVAPGAPSLRPGARLQHKPRAARRAARPVRLRPAR